MKNARREEEFLMLLWIAVIFLLITYCLLQSADSNGQNLRSECFGPQKAHETGFYKAYGPGNRKSGLQFEL